jgi:gliding motility-associated-like protein
MCFPDSFLLQFYDSTTISNDAIASWSWDFGDNQTSSAPQPTHAYASTGTYNVTLAVMSSNGCPDTISKSILSPPTADFDMSTNSTSTSNPAVFFVDSSSVSASSWLWNFDDPASNASNLDINTNTSHVFNNPGDYNILLTVMDANGCMDTALQHLEVISAYSIFVPNAFTPDGNGLNDHFIPEGVLTDNQSFEMLIFNRWGDLIFSTDNLDNPWMGTGNGGKDLVPVGVYVWVINTMDANNTRHQYRGHITIIK